MSVPAVVEVRFGAGMGSRPHPHKSKFVALFLQDYDNTPSEACKAEGIVTSAM
jgi:hypothetical protein